MRTKLETLLACIPESPFKTQLNAEIETLRRQLAELKANSQAVLQTQSEAWQREVAESQVRFEQLEKQLWYEQNISFRNQLNETQRRLEEAQSREQQLRGWVEKWCKFDSLNMGLQEWSSFIAEYRALQSDDTALREMIAKAGEVMRERCAGVATVTASNFNGRIETRIRALPAVALEDLR